ncbi:glycogen synthase GlgA [Facklamia sp. DSM 111018]|uniref:Glycogen synthase n=1 Tax=Facklamia lactis TaxID=2749967 RepID=A0ABS0LPD6_9LACT|nr:glycogen synthase GlgA [Facklamia lactis]MBG9980210.1 glycogen synthase GlgA [Facklamia lactis]MBG9986013.1 glycogen synthase GlgA [Facklamia lactis]
MKILFASAESAPFFKTGGLGDVSYALPKTLAKEPEVDIRVVLPNYSQMPPRYKEELVELKHFRFQLGHKNVYCGIKQLELDGIIFYFIDNLTYFDRAGLYGEWDDGERFAYFSTAIIEMLEVIDWIPDLIHCNDWQTAMVPVLLVDRYHWKNRLQNIRKVLTIHNIRFQGNYDAWMLPNVFGTGYNTFTDDGLKMGDRINFLKGGINFSDRVTTVSPSYAQEIMTPEFGEGLEGVLQYNAWKVKGIVNGIDYQLNDPATDPKLSVHFSIEDLSGKKENKVILQEKLGLKKDPSIPIIGMISRLTDQKGFQLIEEVLDELLQARVQVIILGTGDANFEHSFRYFENRYHDSMRACIQFDINLAQLIYAGSDMFLMPSAFEPCGLSQMIAMRYGTLPIVHETGGLKDTVQAYNQFTGEGTGFSFSGFNSRTMLNTIYFALEVFYDHPAQWEKLMKQAMKENFSWENPAKQYLNLYQELLSE